MDAANLQSAITTGASKFTEAGAGAGASVESIAGPNVGIRCVRSL
jgi:hypothetical protein